jgi:hypothetical protein
MGGGAWKGIGGAQGEDAARGLRGVWGPGGGPHASDPWQHACKLRVACKLTGTGTGTGTGSPVQRARPLGKMGTGEGRVPMMNAEGEAFSFFFYWTAG